VNKWKVIVSLAGICIVACSASNSHARAQTPSPWQTVRSSQPLPSPTLWPAYKALDYKTAHPPLSSREERHVRYVLGRVKPCQRDIVYYVYPSDGDANETLVVFFKGASNSSPHVLGDGDEYYDQEDGNVHAFPEDRPASLEADIRNQSCKPAIVATAKPLPTRSPFPSLWPSFEATDYRSARPPLSAGQKAQLLQVLAQVRTCQRPFVRYAFTNDANDSRRFVLFFQSPHDDWPHVLEQQNLYYKKDAGTTFAVHRFGRAPDFSLAADVRSHPCPGEQGQVGATVLGPEALDDVEKHK